MGGGEGGEMGSRGQVSIIGASMTEPESEPERAMRRRDLLKKGSWSFHGTLRTVRTLVQKKKRLFIVLTSSQSLISNVSCPSFLSAPV